MTEFCCCCCFRAGTPGPSSHPKSHFPPYCSPYDALSTGNPKRRSSFKNTGEFNPNFYLHSKIQYAILADKRREGSSIDLSSQLHDRLSKINKDKHYYAPLAWVKCLCKEPLAK